jgi:hypothetical protein
LFFLFTFLSVVFKKQTNSSISLLDPRLFASSSME